MSNGENCEQESPRPSGIALKLVYRQLPGQEFFSSLLGFAEETTNCPVNAFMNLDSRRRLQGLGLQTRCPHLNLGRLTFPGMEHRLYFSGSGDFGQFCLQLSTLALGVDNPSLHIQSSLIANRLPLGRFMTLLQSDDGPALLVSYSRENAEPYGRMEEVSIALLHTTFVSTVTISNGMLMFRANTKIFGTYSTVLMVSASINEAPWERLPLTVLGVMENELSRSNSSFNYLLQNVVNGELGRISAAALRRQGSAIMAVNRSRNQFSELERQLNLIQLQLDDATRALEEALGNVSAANMTLIQAEEAVQNATDEVRQLMESVSGLCTARQCEEVCQPITSTCYIDTFINETGTCPYIDTETRSIRVRPFYEIRRVWQYLLVCRNPVNNDEFVCSATDSCLMEENLICNGVCKSVLQRVPIYNYEDIQVPVQRLRNCTKLTFLGNMPVPCTTECGIRRPNDTCLRQSTDCRVVRQRALESLEDARQMAVRPLRDLNEAREKLSIANANLAIARARVQNQQQRQTQLIPVFQSAETTRNLAEQTFQLSLNNIQAELNLSRLIEQNPEPFTVLNVTFNINIVAQSPDQFPLLITYITPDRDQRVSTQVTFNFNIPQDLSFALTAEELIDEAFFSPSITLKRSATRKKSWPRRLVRQAEPEVDSNRQQFEQNCVDLQNVQQFISEIAGSFLQIDQSLQEVTMNISQSPDSPDQVQPTDVFASLNLTLLQSVFNISDDESTLNDLRDRVSQNEEYILNLALTENYRNLVADILQGAKDNAFPDWQARLEALYNQSSSVGGYSCLSFTDCLLVATDVLEQLIENTPGELAQILLAELPSARDELLQIGTSMNLTILQAVEKTAPIIDLINRYTESNYWCASPPVITIQPPAEVNVSMNGTLNIECEAESDLLLTYQWRKDGNPIPNANTNNLVIARMQRLDSGNYTCYVFNDAGSMLSINTSVIVFELPEFFLTLVPTSVYEGVDNGAWFACNATAWPFPGWRWYFGQTQESMASIDGEDTNELLIPDPQRRHEGWYTCEAYNGHGSIRAAPVFLRVLPVSVSQQAVPIEFQIRARAFLVQDSQCDSIITIQASVQNSLIDLIDSDTTFISNLDIQQASDFSYTVTFSLVSHNVTENDTSTSDLLEIANRALPTRLGLQRSISAIQEAALQQEFVITCENVNFRIVPSTLTVQRLTYICPPGQQLSTNFILCGKLSLVFMH